MTIAERIPKQLDAENYTAGVFQLYCWIYINDLCKCVKYSETYHFADDTNMLLSHSSLETLAKRMNSDLKNLSLRLKANKLSLNVTKTKLIIFRSSSKKTNPSLKIILDGKRLIQTDTVKYLVPS